MFLNSEESSYFEVFSRNVISTISPNCLYKIKFEPKLPISLSTTFKRIFPGLKFEKEKTFSFKYFCWLVFLIGHYCKVLMFFKSPFWRELGYAGECLSDGTWGI